MAVTTVACVLRRAGDFEHQLMDYYLDLAEQSTREGVRLLTDYMARHRRRLAEALERFPAAEYARISALPLRYEPVSVDCSPSCGDVLGPHPLLRPTRASNARRPVTTPHVRQLRAERLLYAIPMLST